MSIVNDPGLRRVLSVREAADLLHCRLTKLYLLIKAGEIGSYKDGGSRRVHLHSVLEYIDRQAAKGISLSPGFSPNAKAAAERAKAHEACAPAAAPVAAVARHQPPVRKPPVPSAAARGARKASGR
jgi:excisionase family DNA binding protein